METFYHVLKYIKGDYNVPPNKLSKKGQGGMEDRMKLMWSEPILKALSISGCLLWANVVFVCLLPTSMRWIKFYVLGVTTVAIFVAIHYIAPGRRIPQIVSETAVSRLKGKAVVVTGANRGIGLATVKQLALWGCQVYMGCRDLDSGRAAIGELSKLDGIDKKQFQVFHLDLSDLRSVRQFAQKILDVTDAVDILINNAGVMMPNTLNLTKQGLELQFGTNHLGHFLLTQLLMDRIVRCCGKVINVSSIAHVFSTHFTESEIEEVTKSTYDSCRFYAISKACNILFTKELNKRFAQKAKELKVACESSATIPGAVSAVSGQCEKVATSYCLHPGTVKTHLIKYVPNSEMLIPLRKSSFQGAQTSLLLCASPKCILIGGGYYAECQHQTSWMEMCGAPVDSQAESLWKFSERLVKDFERSDTTK